MPVEVRVLHNQSLFDIAIQEYGTIEAAFDLALANDMNVTDTLIPGQVLKIPVLRVEDRDIAQYFKSRKIYPSTALPLINESDVEEYFGSLPGMLHLMLS